jgi:hypothetical protein
MSRKRSCESGERVGPRLRKAIWLTHDKKCAYTGAELHEEAYVIDHVIPIGFNKPERADEKEKVLRELGLPADFDLNGVTNMVPTTIKFNRLKDDKVLPELTAKALKLAAQAAGEVIGLHEKLRAMDKLEEETHALGERYRSQLGERFVAETAYNILRKEADQFTPTEQMGGDHAVIATTNLHLNCFLPKFPDYTGSLLVRFKRVELYGCGITFGQPGIIELFDGLGTPAHVRSRPFIEGYDERNDEYLIQLGNNRFLLSAEETRDLCETLDKLGACYLAKLKRSECEILNSIKFKRSDVGGYLMCAVSVRLWREIVRFAQTHDFADGDTPWHVFDANPHYLKIFCKSRADGRYDYRAFVRPVGDDVEPSGLPVTCAPYVWLRWDPTFLRALRKTESSFKFGTLWDVETTHRWITSELIPEVLRWSYESASSRLPFLYRTVFRRVRRNPPPPASLAEKSRGTEFIEASRMRRLEEFKQLVENLWDHFAGTQSKFISVGAGDGPHELLEFLLENCEPISLDLLRRIADAFESEALPNAIKEAIGRRRKNYVATGALSGWEIKSALEAIMMLLEESSLKATEEVTLSFGLEKMSVIFEEFNRRVYLERFARRG